MTNDKRSCHDNFPSLKGYDLHVQGFSMTNDWMKAVPVFKETHTHIYRYILMCVYVDKLYTCVLPLSLRVWSLHLLSCCMSSRDPIIMFYSGLWSPVGHYLLELPDMHAKCVWLMLNRVASCYIFPPISGSLVIKL